MKARRANALRTADTRIQRADRNYATRADSNLAHFMLPRPDTQLDPFAYGKLALRAGSPLNAPGVYSWYHIGALQKANRLRTTQLAPGERRQLVRAMSPVVGLKYPPVMLSNFADFVRINLLASFGADADFVFEMPGNL